MTYRYIECSGQGLRFDVLDEKNARVCIAHTEKDAKKIVRALSADERKQNALIGGFGKSPLRGQPVDEADAIDTHGQDQMMYGTFGDGKP